MLTLTSESVSCTSDVNDTEDFSSLPCVIVCVGETASGELNEGMLLSLGDRGEFSLGMGEAEGVGPGEGRGERVPISTARSSVQARQRLRRKSSVSLSTTSSLVRWGTSRIRFTTCRKERGDIQEVV